MTRFVLSVCHWVHQQERQQDSGSRSHSQDWDIVCGRCLGSSNVCGAGQDSTVVLQTTCCPGC